MPPVLGPGRDPRVRALPRGCPPPAGACAERAAERAALRFAHGEAAAHLARALEALALVHPPQPERRGDLGLRLAMAQLHAGDAARARATLDGVAPTLRALRRPELLARFALARESIGAALGGDSASDPISPAAERPPSLCVPCSSPCATSTCSSVRSQRHTAQAGAISACSMGHSGTSTPPSSTSRQRSACTRG